MASRRGILGIQRRRGDRYEEDRPINDRRGRVGTNSNMSESLEGGPLQNHGRISKRCYSHVPNVLIPMCAHPGQRVNCCCCSKSLEELLPQLQRIYPHNLNLDEGMGMRGKHFKASEPKPSSQKSAITVYSLC